MSHELDKDIINAMYKRAIDDLDLSSYHVEKDKHLILLGGQPASGKSSVINMITKSHGRNIVTLNSDDYKEFYPNANALLKADPNKITEIHEYSNHTLGLVMSTVAKNGYNVILEGTMRNPDYQLALIDQAKSIGYNVEAYIVSCNEYSSKVGCIERYESEYSQRGFGRHVPQEFHDDAYKNLPETLNKLVQSEKLENILIINRDGNILGEHSKGDDVVKIYTNDRQQLPPELYSEINDRLKSTEKMIMQRDRSDPNITVLKDIQRDMAKSFESQNNITFNQQQENTTLKLDKNSTIDNVLTFFEKSAPDIVNTIRENNTIDYKGHTIKLEHANPKFVAEQINEKANTGIKIELDKSLEKSRSFER